MIYDRDQVLESTKNYFDGDDLASAAFMKYCLKDGENILELNPTQMHRRLASEFARIESKYPNPMSEEKIFNLFDKFEMVIPQGSPMSGIGNPYQIQSISNCFVIDSPYDSYAGILHHDQEQIQIMKRRGGVGGDASTIRPKNMATSNAARTTDGVGIFIERWSNSTREVAQGGRRGARMISLDCRHPEVETFIDIKRDLKKVTGANISVRWTDEFMKAVEDDADFILRWPIEASPETAKITKQVKARQIWNKFIDSAWTMAEPGALFWDTITKKSIADLYADKGYKTESTNPCGEIPLSPYDSCRLMVINLTSFVSNPFTENAQFDFNKFQQTAYEAQRLMDDLVDLEVECVDRIIQKVNNDPEPYYVKQIELDLWSKIKKSCENGRRTGLGITGLGDAIAALNCKYGSDESVNITEEIYKTLAKGAHRSSLVMAKERGAFPIFDFKREESHEYLNRVMLECGPEYVQMWKTTGRRNIALTTTAPVGSVSLLTRTTSGIEPAFLTSYKRRRKLTSNDVNVIPDFVDAMGDKWQEYTVYHHWFKKWMEITGKTDFAQSPYYGATANDIDWVKSVDIQAAAQKWIDHSISKTCNLPNSATRETVNDVYMKAWKSGCKGFTVYRDGCRDGVLISADKKEKKQVEKTSVKRQKKLQCDIHRVNIRNGEEAESWVVLIGMLDGKPYEVFCGIAENIEIPRKYKTGFIIKNGKRDGVTTYNLEVPVGGDEDDNLVFKDIVNLFNNPTQGAFTRTISLALRHGVPIHYVVEQLQKDKNSDIFSYARVIARVLKGYIKDGTKSVGKGCPSCNAADLVYQEGCLSCKNCGYGKCG